MKPTGTNLHFTAAYVAKPDPVTDAKGYAEALLKEEIPRSLRVARNQTPDGFSLRVGVPDGLESKGLIAALNGEVQIESEFFSVEAKSDREVTRILVVQIVPAKGDAAATALIAAASQPPVSAVPTEPNAWMKAAASRPLPQMNGRLWTNPKWKAKPDAASVAQAIIEQLVQPLLLLPSPPKSAQVRLPPKMDVARVSDFLDTQTRASTYLVRAQTHPQEHDVTLIQFYFRQPTIADGYSSPKPS